MSWMASAWAKHCRLGSASRKAVLLVIADFATESGHAVGVDVPEGSAVCWAGIAEIAGHAEVGESTVRRILGDLEAAGVVRRVKRGRRWGIGGRTTDLIFIDYARPFADTTAYRPHRAVSPAPGEPAQPVENPAREPALVGAGAPVTAQSEGGYRSYGEGVSAHLVSAQNLQKNHQPTARNLTSGTHVQTARTRDDETRSSPPVDDAAPTATARPPPARRQPPAPARPTAGAAQP